MTRPAILTTDADTVTPVSVQKLRVARDHIEDVRNTKGQSRQVRALGGTAIDFINAMLRELAR